jgi:hypothetical protein
LRPTTDLAFGNGIFVAVGDGGTIVTSTDGMSWTPEVSGSSELLFNVAFGDGTFVVVGGSQQGVIFTSTDGVNWTKRNSGTSASLSNVAYANGTFIAVGAGGTIVQSDPVVSSPKLTLSVPATQLQFSWPAAAGVFSILQTEQLASPSWSSTPNQVPVMVGDQTVMVASKAVVNARSNSGDTPLRVAVLHGHKDVAEWLRHQGGQE